MGGDPFGMLLRQRIVFLGGEVRRKSTLPTMCCTTISSKVSNIVISWQVNDFTADAIISQLLLLDSTDPTKARAIYQC